jgi:ATP-binding cassette subfamily B protein
MRERLAELGLLIRTAVRTDPWRSLGTLLEPLGRLMYPLLAWCIGLLVNGIVRRDETLIVGAAVGMLVAITLRYVAAYVGTSIRAGLAERVGLAFDTEIVRLTGELPGLEHHEHADFADRLELLRQQQGVLGQSLNALIGTANAVVGALGTLVVLALLHPAVLLLVLFALPTIPIAGRQQRWHAEAEARSAAPSRLARHLRHLSTDAKAGMELRMFGLRHEILGRLETAWDDSRRPLDRAELKAAALASARSVIFLVGYLLAVGFVLWRAARGYGSAGTVATAVVVCQQVQTQVITPAYSVVNLGQALRAAGRLRWLQAYAAARAAEADQTPVAPPDRLRDAIRFEHVSFRYPGTAHDVLRDVSVRIPAGSVVAIVGENGAGKTTLVKLLGKLYTPSAGRLLVDGTDLARIDVTAWRERLSAAFQDFVRFEFSAGRAVGLGDLPRLDDAPAQRGALARAGVPSLEAALPRGLATQLGSTWPDGVELSTGQWQQLALSRALLRRHPLLLCFDEPTASLDAPTEHALFERYIAEAHALSFRGRPRTPNARSDGGVTVLVSHRFSTVRSADLILVLDDGRLVEQGDHQTLLGAGGLYAELYTLQAESYR